MTDCNPNKVPASTEALGSDPEGEPFDEQWNYASIVGMLIYLSTNSRPDITYAVSQVAQFNHNPKKSHGTAVKMILWYLKGMMDKGTIVCLNDELSLDAYSDADFAGLYKREPDTDPVSAKSRLGYIIFLAGFPLIWKSQLQQEITISSTESEYSAALLTLRMLIPLIRQIREATEALGLPQNFRTTL